MNTETQSHHQANPPSPSALDFVVMTTYGATIDDKAGAVTTSGFQWIERRLPIYEYLHSLTRAYADVYLYTFIRIHVICACAQTKWYFCIMLSIDINTLDKM